MYRVILSTTSYADAFACCYGDLAQAVAVVRRAAALLGAARVVAVRLERVVDEPRRDQADLEPPAA